AAGGGSAQVSGPRRGPDRRSPESFSPGARGTGVARRVTELVCHSFLPFLGARCGFLLSTHNSTANREIECPGRLKSEPGHGAQSRLGVPLGVALRRAPEMGIVTGSSRKRGSLVCDGFAGSA